MQSLMENELQTLEDTCHPNIVRIYELLHDDKFYYIIQELIEGGELYDLEKELSEEEIRHIMQQVFLAINYIHGQNIVHRDIKPENILIDNLENLDVKITDFGFATTFDDKSLDDIIGSPVYMPPEIIKGKKYDSKVDIWSAGVVAYDLLAGVEPFQGDTKEELYKNIKKQKPDIDGIGCSQSAKNFLTAVL